jgi:hypothetical protein
LELQKELVSYLRKYGNTRETDLIEYGISISGLTHEEMVKALDEIVVQGMAKRIVHDKLGSNIVYIAKGNWPVDCALSAEADDLEANSKEKILEDAKRILKEAKVVAKKRVRKEVAPTPASQTIVNSSPILNDD